MDNPKIVPDRPSLRHFVHHRGGEIVGAHDAEIEQRMAGAETVEVDVSASGKSPKLFKVVDGKVVPKTTAEIAAAHAPTMDMVRSTIITELQRSDYTQLPDSPCTIAQRQAWREYRATLRALHKGTDAQAVLTAFPTAPDGVQPNQGMRFRMAEMMTRRRSG